MRLCPPRCRSSSLTAGERGSHPPWLADPRILPASLRLPVDLYDRPHLEGAAPRLGHLRSDPHGFVQIPGLDQEESGKRRLRPGEGLSGEDWLAVPDPQGDCRAALQARRAQQVTALAKRYVAGGPTWQICGVTPCGKSYPPCRAPVRLGGRSSWSVLGKVGLEYPVKAASIPYTSQQSCPAAEDLVFVKMSKCQSPRPGTKRWVVANPPYELLIFCPIPRGTGRNAPHRRPVEPGSRHQPASGGCRFKLV